jgi:hypothetical protein
MEIKISHECIVHDGDDNSSQPSLTRTVSRPITDAISFIFQGLGAASVAPL